METSLHAEHYADSATWAQVEIVENVQLATDTYRCRFRCPEVAARIVPGQFLMLKLSGYDDPLIGRPLALYDTVLDAQGTPEAVDVVYIVKGKLTSRLAKLGPGQQLSVWGPLGNGFPPHRVDHLIMVAGGIGQTPFLALAQQYRGRKYGVGKQTPSAAEKITFVYGARRADLLAGVDDFERYAEVRIATDDGSRGHHGLVTDVLAEILAVKEGTCRVVCCGPEPMMQAVAELAAANQVPCEVSLETPMACGIGICFTCVARIRDANGVADYRRTCVEGPVFDAALVEW